MFAVDNAREDVLAHRGWIVHRLRDGAEPFDAQALHVGVAEGRVQHHVGEDLQHRLERGGERGDVRAGGIGIGLGAVARAQILESAGDGGRVASGCALAEKVERERGKPGLSARLGVRAGADVEQDGHERDVVALDEEYLQPVREHELLRDGRVEVDRGAGLRRQGAELRIGSGGRGCFCASGFRCGGWVRGRGTGRGEAQRDELLHCAPPAACFCSGVTVITTR